MTGPLIQISALEKTFVRRAVLQSLDVDIASDDRIALIGSNGAGKTTTIGKLAKKYKDEGKSVMLAAGDTFRAAAVEQQTVAVSEVARSAQAAAQNTEAVERDATGVAEGAQSSVAAAEEISNLARELESSADTLATDIDSFIKSVRAA